MLVFGKQCFELTSFRTEMNKSLIKEKGLISGLLSACSSSIVNYGWSISFKKNLPEEFSSRNACLLLLR